jgi:hypothetical protein
MLDDSSKQSVSTNNRKNFELGRIQCWSTDILSQSQNASYLIHASAFHVACWPMLGIGKDYKYL